MRFLARDSFPLSVAYQDHVQGRGPSVILYLILGLIIVYG